MVKVAGQVVTCVVVAQLVGISVLGSLLQLRTHVFLHQCGQLEHVREGADRVGHCAVREGVCRLVSTLVDITQHLAGGANCIVSLGLLRGG